MSALRADAADELVSLAFTLARASESWSGRDYQHHHHHQQHQ
jgi:hypothetical protein